MFTTLGFKTMIIITVKFAYEKKKKITQSSVDANKVCNL